MPEVLAFPPSPPMKSTPSPEAIGRLTQLMQLCTFHEVLRQAHRSVTGQIPLDVESIAAIEFTAGSVLEVVFVPSPELASARCGFGWKRWSRCYPARC